MDHKKPVQTLINLLSSAFGLDIGLIDRNRVTIAGSGTFEKNVGLKVPRKSMAAKSMFMEKSYFVKNGRYEPECYHCKFRKACPYNMALINPILLNDTIAGSIFFLSTNENERCFISDKKNYLRRNLEDISSVMTDNVLCDDPFSDSNNICHNFKSIVDSWEKGVLIAGNKRDIKYLNPAAETILKCQERELLGGNIDSILFKKGNMPGFDAKKNILGKNVRYNMHKVMNKNTLAGYVIKLEQDSPKKIFTPLCSEKSDPFEKIIGESPSIKSPIKKARKIANLDSPVLLLGETGTGKDLFARGIHESSSRKNKKFIIINCSAVPENLLESEMFGYEEGAFTGAKKGGKSGKFQLAQGGTLFLDEIGDMPMTLQAKLLRVIEDGVVEKVGSTTNQEIDVRIISATNKNLEEMIARNTFRKDLYYRLNVIQIDLPPLQKRREDILLLSERFLSDSSRKANLPSKSLSNETKNYFLSYPWDGNIRELKNTIEYLVQTSQKETIEVTDLPESIKQYYHPDAENASCGFLPENWNELQLLEKNAIEGALKKFGSSTEAKKTAAKHLGMSLTTLYRRLKFYQIA